MTIVGGDLDGPKQKPKAPRLGSLHVLKTQLKIQYRGFELEKKNNIIGGTALTNVGAVKLMVLFFAGHPFDVTIDHIVNIHFLFLLLKIQHTSNICCLSGEYYRKRKIIFQPRI